jgi:hypothetical protein
LGNLGLGSDTEVGQEVVAQAVLDLDKVVGHPKFLAVDLDPRLDVLGALEKAKFAGVDPQLDGSAVREKARFAEVVRAALDLDTVRPAWDHHLRRHRYKIERLG